MPVIAIDGPAGVGKTTAARNLADILAIPLLNSGAMFRSLALELGTEAAGLSHEQLQTDCARFHYELSGDPPVLHCNGRPIGNEIQGERVAALASKLAVNPVIRKYLREEQRNIAARKSVVTEGRDMGTVVFPEAKFKFFLDATPEVRAMRRWLELKNAGHTASLPELEEKIRLRDRQDRNRSVAPLMPAPDAIIIDTSHIGIEETVQQMLRLIDANGGRSQFFSSAF